ncbi:hippurate hydrolase [Caminicella sporogenes DSM 14501]|uniref:Hippurate hydrolase n=1 Tax=Caminicella sporogenes DSM 14501 TaxID=1121266 RepID=A0A1M6R5K9_9FIRM|nr:M20 family metallopeptidase [Caminicella sporogenes]RKD27313.1 amidohydrolase [Caminicella sporogenes]SHK27761.1 hippurate hydrolase [Caminicella sporogenes DSM 14501]
MIQVCKEIENLSDEIINIRRYLHQIPELGFEEYETSKYIAKYLEDIGIQVYKNVAKTGVVGYIRGNNPKRTVAFRADIDALPVEENTKVPYCSKYLGKMHACGHDGHTAILLGLAKYLSLNKDKLRDNVLLIFQPAEEGPGGAEVIIREGILKKFKVDCIYGLHLYPEVEEGKVALRSGPLMAQTGEFDIYIYGKSGHGAIPQNAVDSIIISADVINSLQTIISRSINPIKPAVLTIGRIEGGERRNVIAGKVVLEGTIRAFEESVYNKIKDRMIEILKGKEIVHNCKIELIFRDMYPPVNNDENMVNRFIDIIGKENIEIIDPQMISEDYSYYQRELPGLFFFLGVRNEKEGYIYPLHNSQFNFNERVLAMGVQIYVNLLKGNGYIS